MLGLKRFMFDVNLDGELFLNQFDQPEMLLTIAMLMRASYLIEHPVLADPVMALWNVLTYEQHEKS